MANTSKTAKNTASFRDIEIGKLFKTEIESEAGGTYCPVLKKISARTAVLAEGYRKGTKYMIKASAICKTSWSW